MAGVETQKAEVTKSIRQLKRQRLGLATATAPILRPASLKEQKEFIETMLIGESLHMDRKWMNKQITRRLKRKKFGLSTRVPPIFREASLKDQETFIKLRLQADCFNKNHGCPNEQVRKVSSSSPGSGVEDDSERRDQIDTTSSSGTEEVVISPSQSLASAKEI